MSTGESALYAWFERACTLKPAEREHLLAEVAALDVGLAHELRSLLLADQRARARQGEVSRPGHAGPPSADAALDSPTRWRAWRTP